MTKWNNKIFSKHERGAGKRKYKKTKTWMAQFESVNENPNIKCGVNVNIITL